MKSLLVGGVMLSMATLPEAQQNAAEPGAAVPSESTPLIRVQVEFIDVAHEQLTALMFGEHGSANDDELRDKVGELVKQGKANILDTLLCTTGSGKKATTESIEEYIYATEYEPAQATTETHTLASGEKVTSEGRDAAFGPTPSAWETRNLGSTLEIEPLLSADAKTIGLRFVPEIVYHIGDQVWAEWKDAHGRADIKMPIIYVMRLNTSISTVAGDYLLAAALSPKNQDGFPDFSRKVMIFVKCDVLTTPR